MVQKWGICGQKKGRAICPALTADFCVINLFDGFSDSSNVPTYCLAVNIFVDGYIYLTLFLDEVAPRKI